MAFELTASSCYVSIVRPSLISSTDPSQMSTSTKTARARGHRHAPEDLFGNISLNVVCLFFLVSRDPLDSLFANHNPGPCSIQRVRSSSGQSRIQSLKAHHPTGPTTSTSTKCLKDGGLSRESQAHQCSVTMVDFTGKGNPSSARIPLPTSASIKVVGQGERSAN